MYFEYGNAEICYLKEGDARLAAVIDSVGHIYRETDADLFSSIVHHIIYWRSCRGCSWISRRVYECCCNQREVWCCRDY